MQLLRAPRVLLAAGCLAAGLVGGLVAAERSSAAMATAATSFLSSLSPEQRQKATFAFELGRAAALALHSDRGLPAEGPDARR